MNNNGTVGVKEFDEAVKVWQRSLEDIIIGLVTARTSDGLASCPQDTNTLITEFNSLTAKVRENIDSGTKILAAGNDYE